MGNPLYGDDDGKMCFNAAKNWQLGWYDTHKVLVNPRNQPVWSGRLVGIADFSNNPSNHPVVVKIESETSTDAFVAFNRAAGINSQNAEADGKKSQVCGVLVVDTPGM